MIRAIGWCFGAVLLVGLSVCAALLIAAVVCYAAGAKGATPPRLSTSRCSPDCACGCNDGAPCDCGSSAEYKWLPILGTGGDEVALYRAGRQVGGFRISTQTYHPRLRPGVWGQPCPPPTALPEWCCHRRRDRSAVTNYGVDLPPAEEHRRGWSISGKPVSENEAKEALATPPKSIGASPVPDDSGKPWILWVGDDATGAKIAADAGDKARVQSVQPGSWQTCDRDGKPMFGPGIWFVRATDRKAVGHEAAYTGTAQLAEGLRRCDPGWTPSSVPDLSTPSIPSLDVPPIVTVPASMIGGSAVALAGLYFLRRKKSSAPPTA